MCRATLACADKARGISNVQMLPNLGLALHNWNIEWQARLFWHEILFLPKRALWWLIIYIYCYLCSWPSYNHCSVHPGLSQSSFHEECVAFCSTDSYMSNSQATRNSDLVTPLQATFVCNGEISWTFPARSVMGVMSLTRWQTQGLVSAVMEINGKVPTQTSTKEESSWLLTGCMPQTVKPVSYFKRPKEHIGNSYGRLLR